MKHLACINQLITLVKSFEIFCGLSHVYVWGSTSTRPEHIYNSHYSMGCRQCSSLSVVQLKGKHCRKPHCCNGVVDTFEPGWEYLNTSNFCLQVCTDYKWEKIVLTRKKNVKNKSLQFAICSSTRWLCCLAHFFAHSFFLYRVNYYGETLCSHSRLLNDYMTR